MTAWVAAEGRNGSEHEECRVSSPGDPVTGASIAPWCQCHNTQHTLSLTQSLTVIWSFQVPELRRIRFIITRVLVMLCLFIHEEQKNQDIHIYEVLQKK